MCKAFDVGVHLEKPVTGWNFQQTLFGAFHHSMSMAAASSPRSFSGIACFLVIFLYSTWIGATFPKLPTLTLIFTELAFLAFCEFGPLSDFGARKLCHSCSGLLMLHLDPQDVLAR